MPRGNYDKLTADEFADDRRAGSTQGLPELDDGAAGSGAAGELRRELDARRSTRTWRA